MSKKTRRSILSSSTTKQYSIWPADRELPLGWREVGKSGLKAECLDYIKEVWTDMRPLSLRKKMEEDERHRAEQG
ncbi:MAG: MbtH family NRPS accessory protein [Kouleothrix sp.]